MEIVKASALTKRYDGFTAVDGINFSVNEGEVFGFLGPNGAGKTTTMRMIQCVSPKTSGFLTVAGMEVSEKPREIKSLLGVAPQEANLDPDFTVYENMMAYSRYFAIPKNIAHQRTMRLLEFFQLEGRKDTQIDELSGGMKRRLLLARSMLNDPRILILDEPTVGLDPQARHLIWDQLMRLRGQGKTILLTTHYMEEAARLCDRLVIMDNGEILAEGAPRELVKRFVKSSVIESKDGPDVRACLAALKEELQLEQAGEELHIFTDRPKETLAVLMQECAIDSTTVRDATLEDVFLKLTGRRLRE